MLWGLWTCLSWTVCVTWSMCVTWSVCVSRGQCVFYSVTLSYEQCVSHGQWACVLMGSVIVSVSHMVIVFHIGLRVSHRQSTGDTGEQAVNSDQSVVGKL